MVLLKEKMGTEMKKKGQVDSEIGLNIKYQ